MPEIASNATLDFSRVRVLLWVCDLEHSASALNDPARVTATEEYLQRLYWVSLRLAEATGAAVCKWTGDGFLMAYAVPLERDLGAIATTVFNAAWNLTLMSNVTSFAVAEVGRMRLRHGVAFEPDAILVKQDGPTHQTDIIGRGVVLASRLAGVPAAFPSILADGRTVKAARAHGSSHHFRKRKFANQDLLRFFKGERRGTSDVFESAEQPVRAKSRAAVLRQANRAIQNYEQPPPDAAPRWLKDVMRALLTGPPWANEVAIKWHEFAEVQLLGNLKTLVEAFSAATAVKSVTTVKPIS